MHSKMTIGRKLTLIGAFLMGLTLVLGVATLFGLRSLEKIIHSIAEDSMVGVVDSSKAEAAFLELRGDVWRHISATNDDDIAAMDRDILLQKKQIETALDDVSKSIFTSEEWDVYGKIKPALEKYYQSWDKVAALSRAQKNAEAYKVYVADAHPAFLAAKEAITAETNYNRRAGLATSVDAVKMVSKMNWLSWVVLLISLSVGIVTLLLVVRSINQVLTRSVTELSEGARQIASASSQVASSSQSLAQGASEQAASLEETSASGEEITSMTRKNAENSQTAATVMEEVDRNIAEGNRTLGQMVVSMEEITSSSDKISKIIKVIDEIAFQTNILALNAAVEAARAGEAGMGFAVVADEVRNLAQRSAQAAKDTSALIEESISKSNQGSQRLNQVTEVIRSITGSATKVKMLVDEVNLGSQEQARGIEQISKAISQMDQLTQTTAANAEESASASEELSAQAEALGQIVVQLQTLVGAGSAKPAGSGHKPDGKAGRNRAEVKSAVNHAPAKSSARDLAPFPLDDHFAEM